MNNRDSARSRYSGLYRLAPSERSEFGWPICVYCGDPADSIDHVPPLNRVDDYRALCVQQEAYLLIKFCKPCNTLLSDDLHNDIFERIDALKHRLKKKIKRDDYALQWSKEDIAALGKNLRSKVVSSMKKIESTQRRIDYRGGYKAILNMSNNP